MMILWGFLPHSGGESHPPTPPPLRAVKLTPRETTEKIKDALKKVKLQADKLSLEREQHMKDNLASHDSAIRKCKNIPVERKYSGFNYMNLQQNRIKRSPLDHGSKKNLPCTLHCPGSYGLLPNLTCVSCQCLFHARCQGMTQANRLFKTFKCKACSLLSNRNSNPLASSSHSSPSSSTPVRSFTVGQVNSIVNVKLPMTNPNGRRPIVELVMHQNGKYQPIKFSNNMQVSEMISKTIFERATTLQRTLYQKARKVPRVNGRPIFLAINPTTQNNRGQLNALFSSAQLSRQSNSVPSLVSSSTSEVHKSDQVSILVRSQSSPKPVLLNVPRKIAIKVKAGTTLSFSASSDQKYTVIDSKIHPPVNSSKRSATSSTTTTNSVPVPKRRAPDLTVYRGITISRITDKRPPQPTRRIPPPAPAAGHKVSSELEINPCTPYCPGVTGFPEVECKGCQSLFHAQCVGLLNSRSMSNFYCKMCSRTRTSIPRSTPQVINLD
ncbi:uncharacterized protein [Lepeophtheirus salmonis]|uniref:uncharacterized protein n=1 Tax=Lepeophtheirus salmonis TaxID=72036 RepID=UPI003AF3AA6C